jgi:hypothetical protein
MSNDNLHEYYDLKCATCWTQLYDFCDRHFNSDKQNNQWVFRGQADSSWGLKSTLERALEYFEIDLSKKASGVELGLLRKFKRHYHHYLESPIENDNSLEWLAIMQHYGTPTRLLDWTYSFYVALYFAMNHVKENGSASVWALDTDWIGEVMNGYLGSLEGHGDAYAAWKDDKGILEKDTFKKIFAPKQKPPIALIGVVSPLRLNKRLTIQQGTFLCPGDVTKTFEENLIALLTKRNPESKSHFIKLVIHSEQKNKILEHLQRMNMNDATLFPGLDGLARSLRTLMVSPDIFLNPGNEEL